MRRRGATATTDDVGTKITGKMNKLRRESFGRLVIMHLAFFNRRQTGVRQNRNRQRRVLAQVANALSHVPRPGTAIHTDHVNWKRRQRRQRRADLSAVEHGTERFDGDLRDHRDAHPVLFKVLEDRGQRSLGLQQILTRFDYQQIDAAIEQSARLLGIRGLQLEKTDVAESRQLAARPHRAGDPTRLIFG